MLDNEYDDDDEVEERNDTVFEDIQSTFKDLVLDTKRQLYNCIIKGPSIESKKAQDNTLLIEYTKKLNILYHLCNALNTGTINPNKIENKLSSFPIETRDNVKHLITWITEFINKNEYVDTIPYHDYLEVHLLRHPFLQK